MVSFIIVAVSAVATLPEIQLNDRIAVFGRTGTGKSILAHYMFKSIPVRLPTESNPKAFWRICVDVTDSVVDDALVFFDPLNIPWDEAASLRYVPNVETMETDIDNLYLSAFFHGSVWLWLDEANEVSTAHRTIPGLRRVLLQGRKFQVGHCAVTPRPVDINRSIITQSEHLFIFPLTDTDDRTRIAKNIGLDSEEFEDTMAALPDFAYLWFDVRSGTLFTMPPLPLEVAMSLEGEN